MSNTLSKRNFTEGPLFARLFLFALPLMLSGLLQVGYDMADKIVVGRFSSDPNALAAVGCTSIISTCLINFALGFGSGAGVIVAQHFGAKNEKKLEKAIHTSVLLSIVFGLALGTLGFALSKPILLAMDTKTELLNGAILYLRIICIGIPGNLLYNFGAAVLRSIGDSKSSLYILAFSGLLNVLLNLVFVIGCDMTVDGVALATIISQYTSALMVVIIMMRQNGSMKLVIRKLKFDFVILKSIVKIGLPSGIQSSLFSISNLVITKAFNTFSTSTIHARTVVTSVDSIVVTLINSYTKSAMTFTAQNYGAGNLNRIKKVFLYSAIQCIAICVLVSQIILLFRVPIASLYIGNNNENIGEILAIASDFFAILLNTYFICGIMDLMSVCLKGIKYALSPMLISVFCAIPFRILWVYLVFPYEPFDTANWLMASFPISWVTAIIPYSIMLAVAWRKLGKKFAPLPQNQDKINTTEEKECQTL